MAAIMYLVLFLAMAGHSSALYCLCKDGVGDSTIQKAIDYACGAGADCSPILQNGACYNPNTVKDHCNYAVNSYFQKKGQASGSCDFAGAATTSANPPSNVAANCVFPSTASTTTGTGNGTGTTPTTTTTTPTTSTTPSTTTGTPNVFGGTTGTLGPTGSGTGSITDSSGGLRLSVTTYLFFSLAVASSLAGLWGLM
ncbi:PLASMODESMATA CALLOSE-BINDING PROTEIN 3-like [Mangifera indica]|uniref:PLASMODESMATA CALLOSE-BINDING PROTEIN 3-like n=1 Tax=Mangifera indica TaxID=29780 RepID=UPI001CF9E8E0|nr:PLASMODESMATA CALLOSE-BINDING PROTEIN 3-like [Mangifera indica]